MPFKRDLSIDDAAFRRHLGDLAKIDGIAAITINGHSSEVHALTFDEQRHTLELAKAELGTRVPVVVGIFSDSSLEAARLARMAHENGADGLLVFPPQSMFLGGHLRPEMAREHLARVTGESDLPIILFEFPATSGLMYPFDTLLALCAKFPTIRAIKDQCGEPPLHERHIRELHGLSRPVNVLTTHSSWLLGSLVLGCRGILSGAGSVIANRHVALWRAIQVNNLAAARAVSDRLYYTTRAFYGAPLVDMHNRMKEALVILGRLDAAYVRPPLVKLRRPEIDEIASLLQRAGLTAETLYAKVA